MDDKRLLELDALSAMVEEYGQEHYPISTPSLSETIIERRIIPKKPDIDPTIVPAL